MFFNKTLFLMVGAGAVGALAAGLTSEVARWLWATFLAAVSTGRAPRRVVAPKCPAAVRPPRSILDALKSLV